MSDCRFGVSPVNYPDPDMEQTLSRFAIKVDEKALKSPERNRRASANISNKILSFYMVVQG